jgi:hypothetical protein
MFLSTDLVSKGRFQMQQGWASHVLSLLTQPMRSFPLSGLQQSSNTVDFQRRFVLYEVF